MKRNYIIGSVACMAALWAVAQTTLTPEKLDSGKIAEIKAVSLSEFPTYPAADASNFSEGWVAINVNQDTNNGEEVTWKPNYESDAPNDHRYCAKTGYSPSNGLDMDDYLVSPAVTLEAGNEYTIVITYRIGSYYDKDNLAVYASTSDDLEEVKTTAPLLKLEEAYESSYVNKKIQFTPDSDGDYKLYFHCYSPKFQSGVWIHQVKFMDKIAPSPVTNLEALVAEDNSISCTLSWALPTTDEIGEELAPDAIEKVLVYRDDATEPIELAGDALNFTDNEETGLTGGKHTYAVSVVVGGVESKKTTVNTRRVGPPPAVKIPAKITFGSEEDFEEWSTRKSPDAGALVDWKYNSAKDFAQLTISYLATDDNWLISPPVTVEETGYYKVNVLGVMTSGSEAKFSIAYATTPEIAAMQNPTTEFDLPIGDAWTTDFPETGKTIYLEPGTYYIGIHDKLGKKNENYSNDYSYYVKGLNIEKGEYIPGMVSELTAKGAEDLSNNISLSWKNPIVDGAGQPMNDKEYVLKIYLNDDETPVATISDKAEEYVLPVPSPGVYTIKVITEAADGSAVSDAVTVKTSWIGNPTVNLPYSTAFNPEEDSAMAIWESFIIDGNNDGDTFYLYYNYNGVPDLRIKNNAASYNDFCLSPYFNLEAGTYKLKIQFDGGSSSYPAQMITGLAKGGAFSAADPHQSMTVIEEKELTNYYGYTLSQLVTITEPGSYQIVIGEVIEDGNYSTGLQIKGFSIEKNLPHPDNVTDLTVVANPDNEEEALISWTNPSTVYGTEEALESIESVVIMRDGKVVGTVTEGLEPGQPASFTDLLPSGGEYTYTVYATLNGAGHGDEYATVTSPWVGGGIVAPLIMDATDEKWTIVDTHNDLEPGPGGAWYQTNGWYLENNLYLWYVHNHDTNPADDYIIAPPVKVKENELYKVTFEVLPNIMGETKNCVASVKMGKGTDHTSLPEVATVEVTEADPTNSIKQCSFYVAVGKSTPKTVVGKASLRSEDITAEEAAELYKDAVKLETGSHTIALHANQNKVGLRVSAMRFEKVADLDLTTGLETINVENIYIDGNVIYFPGETDVTVYDISGICVAAAEGCVDSFELPALNPGYYIIKVGDKTFKVVLK